jgi:hypothetical protein
VTVRVVAADADDGGGGAGGVQELGGLPGGAVVRDLEDIRVPDRAAGEYGELRGLLDVAGEQ